MALCQTKDHRFCLLKQINEDWVWIDFAPQFDRVNTLVVLRQFLHDPAKWFSLITILNTYFWNDERHVTSRQVRHLHCNPLNWPLIPFMPNRYRKPQVKRWGQRLIKKLGRKGMLEEYQKRKCCCVCGCP